MQLSVIISQRFKPPSVRHVLCNIQITEWISMFWYSLRLYLHTSQTSNQADRNAADRNRVILSDLLKSNHSHLRLASAKLNCVHEEINTSGTAKGMVGWIQINERLVAVQMTYQTSFLCFLSFLIIFQMYICCVSANKNWGCSIRTNTPPPPLAVNNSNSPIYCP